MLSQQRRRIITDRAEFIAELYRNEYTTRVDEIVRDEGIKLHPDHYEDAFDGMIVFAEDSDKFHIHLNKDKGNYPDSKRGRFTLSHELGHYFIEEHHTGLKNGELQPHPSHFALNYDEPIEEEADCFSARLLMPRDRLRQFTGGKSFSLELIQEVSEAFQTSILSSAIRFAEDGTHEILVVFSKNNQVQWFKRSEDFPRLPFKFKVGEELPPTSVAGEYFIKEDSKYTGIEQVFVDDWFYDNHKEYEGWPMYEQCFYSETYGYVVSLVWFE